MIPQYIAGQKLVTGILALIMLWNINWFPTSDKNIDVEFKSHYKSSRGLVLKGYIILNEEKHPIRVTLEGGRPHATINNNITKDEKITDEKKDITNRNITENINTDRTVGKRKIVIEDTTPSGRKRKVVYDAEIGTIEPNEFDKEMLAKLINSGSEYADSIKEKPLKDYVTDFFKGFTDFIQEKNKPKSKWRLPFFNKL